MTNVMGEIKKKSFLENGKTKIKCRGKKLFETSIEKIGKSGNERCGKAWKELTRFANEKREIAVNIFDSKILKAEY